MCVRWKTGAEHTTRASLSVQFHGGLSNLPLQDRTSAPLASHLASQPLSSSQASGLPEGNAASSYAGSFTGGGGAMPADDEHMEDVRAEQRSSRCMPTITKRSAKWALSLRRSSSR